ncbi:MAG: hypothetical protein IAE79_18735 [Anaerolinea sp.]|nr:hypothetical protein [Anaerolinea sp.]
MTNRQVTPLEQNAFLDQVATAIQRRGLRLPAIIALQIGHPLTFLGGQLVWVAQPALSLFLPTQTIRQVARLLEETDAVQGLIDRLETGEG